MHSQYMRASGNAIPAITKVNDKKDFLIAQMAQQVSATNKSK